MEKARGWFNKFMSKDKSKASKKNDATGNGKEVLKVPTSEDTPSNVTKQKVAAAKQYIEDHYKKQMKSLQERRERYVFFLNNALVMLETVSLHFKLSRFIVSVSHLLQKKNILILQSGRLKMFITTSTFPFSFIGYLHRSQISSKALRVVLADLTA